MNKKSRSSYTETPNYQVTNKRSTYFPVKWDNKQEGVGKKMEKCEGGVYDLSKSYL